MIVLHVCLRQSVSALSSTALSQPITFSLQRVLFMSRFKCFNGWFYKIRHRDFQHIFSCPFAMEQAYKCNETAQMWGRVDVSRCLASNKEQCTHWSKSVHFSFKILLQYRTLQSLLKAGQKCFQTADTSQPRCQVRLKLGSICMK